MTLFPSIPARLAALPLALGAVFPAQAQTAAQPAALQETVVTATRVEQPLSDLVADVSILDHEAIERSGATGLADVLARLPGVEMVRNGGPGTTTQLFLRGAETRYTAVFVDGVRVDSQSGSGGVSLESLPLGLIDRIEVLRGPAAAVYGSDAVAGVIQIFTKRGEAGVSPYVGVGAGSYNTWRAEAGVSGVQGMVDYALGVQRETSRGYNAKRPGASRYNPDRDGYRATSANARLGLRINAEHRVEGTLLYNDSNSGWDDSATFDDRGLRRLQALGLNWHAQWSGAYSTRVSVTDTRDRYVSASGTTGTTLAETQLRSYLLHNTWRLGAHQLTAALERREDRLDAAPTVIRDRRSQNALALGYGLHLGAHTLQLNARYDDDSDFGGKATGSAAYGYAFSTHWRATASVGTAFRAPTVYQQFYRRHPGTSLESENGRNVELGLQWREGGNSVSATVYRNNVDNLINWTGTAATCFGNPQPALAGCYDNVGKARYQGVTLAGSYRLAGWSLHGSADWQDPRNLDTDKLLARRARRHATLGADTQWAGWTLGAELQAYSQRFDDAKNTKPLEGYTLLGLYASTRIARDYQLVARVDNLADRDYVLASGYATAGRSFYVGLKWAPQY